MALEAETKKVVSQFELADHDVNAATLEFLRQMGTFPRLFRPAVSSDQFQGPLSLSDKTSFYLHLAQTMAFGEMARA